MLLFACTSGQSTWQRIENDGVLRVGLDPTYPPFEVAAQDSVQGIDVDLADAIAAVLGLETSFTYFGYDGLYDALDTGQVDVLISALVAEPARTGDFAYSDGYVDSGLVLITQVEAPLSQVNELKGKTISVELGAAGHVESTIWQRQIPDMTVTPLQSSDQALSALIDDEVDAALVDNITARLYAGRLSGEKFHMIPVTTEPYVMVVRRQDDRLLRELNHALDSVRSSGQLDTILNNWLGG